MLATFVLPQIRLGCLRASLSDEDWIASAGMDEESWIGGMAQLGVDVRPYLNVVA